MGNKYGDSGDLTMDDGTEGSGVGYLTPGQMVSEASEEKLDEDEGDDKDKDSSEEGELLDDDEDDSDEDDDEPDELEERRKALEKNWTEKYRQLSRKSGMIRMMERVQENPEEGIPWLAEQFGIDILDLVPDSKKDVRNDEDFKLPDLSGIQPGKDEMMPDFMKRLVSESIGQVAKQLPSMIKSSAPKPERRSRSSNRKEPFGERDRLIDDAIAHLDKRHEDWVLYEDDMVGVLKEKPELIEDPSKLYKEAKEKSGLFAKRAASKEKKERRRVSSGMRGTGKRKTSSKGKVMNMNEAWNRAKQDVSRRK